MPVTKEQADLAAKFIAAHESGSQLLSPDRLAKAESMVREFAAQNPPEAAPPPREPLKFKQIERGGIDLADPKMLAGQALNALGGFSAEIVPAAVKAFASGIETDINDPGAIIGMPSEPGRASASAQWIDEARAMDPHPRINAALGGLFPGGLLAKGAGLLSETGTAARALTADRVGKALIGGAAAGGVGHMVSGAADYAGRELAGQNTDETVGDRAESTLDSLGTSMGIGAGAGALGMLLGAIPAAIRNRNTPAGRALLRNEELSGGLFPNSPPKGLMDRVHNAPEVVEAGMEPIDVAASRARGPIARAHIDADTEARAAMAERSRAYETSDEGQAKLPATRSAETLLEVVRQGRFGPDEGHALIPGERERLLENLRQVVTPKYIPEEDVGSYAQANPGVRVVGETEAIRLGVTPRGPRPGAQGLPGDLLEQIAAGEKSVPPGVVSGIGGKSMAVALEPKRLSASELERMIGNVDDLAGYDRVRGGKGGDESMWARAAREDRAQYQGNAATADAPEVTINVGGQKVTLPRGSYQAFKHAHGEETRGLQARGKLLGIQGENPNPEDPLLLQNVASAIRPSWGGTPGRQDVEQAINDLLFEHPELRPLMKDVRATNLQEQLASGTTLGKASSQSGLIARGAKKGAMYADPLLRGGSNISMSMALSPADKAPVTPGEDAQSKYDTLDRLVAQLRGWNPLAPSPRTP